MDSYDSLLHSILENSVLSEAIDDLDSRFPDALNLIDLNWEERLENNLTYKDLHENVKTLYRPEFSYGDISKFQFLNKKFPILVVSQCRFQKPYPQKDKVPDNRVYINTINSKPLENIATAMTCDLKNISFANEFKFNIPLCSPLSCSICKEKSQYFKEKGYVIDKISQPCIADTKVFDGEGIFNYFTSQIEDMFSSNFVALLSLEITNRYTFKREHETFYRISGKILEMIVFRESKLYEPKLINLAPIIHNECNILSESTENEDAFQLPTVKRPMDEEDEDIIEAIPNKMNKRQRLDPNDIVEESKEFII